jgi:hypothetical protein
MELSELYDVNVDDRPQFHDDDDTSEDSVPSVAKQSRYAMNVRETEANPADYTS